MLRTLLLMLILLAGLIAGPYLAGKQGYVLIETANYAIEMSITTLVIFFVLALALVYLLEWSVTRFCRLSNHTYSYFARRKRQKAQRQTLEGLMRMNEGNYAKAEKLIGKNAKHSDEPVLNFVKAAEAAQQKGDEFAANHYLMQATEIAGSDNLMLEIARTRIMLLQHKLPAARSAVDSLLELAPKNTEVLKLALEIYQQSAAFQALDNILAQIERAQLYSGAAFERLEQQVIDGLLDEKMKEEGAEGLLAWWHNQARSRQQTPYAQIALISRLIECNDQESAYKLSLASLKKLKDEQSELVLLLQQINKLQPTDNHKLVKLLEKRSKQATNRQLGCAYHRALAYLYARADQFEQATDAFKQLLAQGNCSLSEDITMATYVFEHSQDSEALQQLQKQNLQLLMPQSEVAEKPERLEQS